MSQPGTRTPARRGFAAMDKDRQREIARKGGASVPDEKRSFSQDRDLAAAAGRKGGEASHGGGRQRGGEQQPTSDAPRR
jgi:general stress protein YciG